MSSTDTAQLTPTPERVSLKLELAVLPVADVNRAKDFYFLTLGWRLDADFSAGADFRVVQVTPPGSPGSVIFGAGITSGAPGSGADLVLVVSDIDKARAELVGRGVVVSEIFHDAGGVFHHAGTDARVAGPDPQRRSYASWASFSDPDGNRWFLQEITTRRPGRVSETDVNTLADLLHETEEHHGPFEKTAPKHDWWVWYAAYMDARQHGQTPEEASDEAGRHVAQVVGSKG